jgi:GT2 family glycosyltransferase
VDCIFVVIGYNNPQLTAACIESFRHVGRAIPVWLYDNASSPELRQVATKLDVPYFRSERNLGFAGGANLAIDWALNTENPRAVCLVNNDIVVSEAFAQSLEPELEHFLVDPRLAAMTPLLYIDANYTTPENFGVLYYRSGLAFQNRTGRLDPRALLNGAFLFLKSGVCRQLIAEDRAVFRESYFFNAEDIELSLRLLSRSYTIRVNPNLRAQHFGSQSAQHISVTSFWLAWRNLLWTALITRSNPELVVDFPFILAGQIVQLALASLRGRPDLVGSVVAQTWRNREQLMMSRRSFLAQRRSGFRQFLKPGVFPLRQIAVAQYR